jgi:CubicO group peptidase (beta-lactamase class C family)
MNTLKYICILAAFLIAGCSCRVKAQLFKKTFEVNGRVIKIKELNKQIEEVLDKTSLPGLSFAVIDHNKVVFYNTYGYKQFDDSTSRRPKGTDKVNKRTVFEACSLSKSFFAFAVHKLVDQGILNLDTPLYRHLKHPELEYDERYRKITARMVLSHSSGLENWQKDNNPRKLEIISESGKFSYSGEGYVYLSKVIEKILGKSIENYMKELVYESLNLRRTFSNFSEDGKKPRNYASGHNPFLHSFKKEKRQSPLISSIIHTTAKDYAQVLISLFDGNHLSKERVADLTGPGTFIRENSFYVPGIAKRLGKGDTVFYQAGNNEDFKGFGFYSYKRKSGYVMFVNGERGTEITKILDSLTVRQGDDGLFNEDYQYPNLIFEMLNIYNKEGHLTALNYFKGSLAGENVLIAEDNFEELGEIFLEKEPELSAYITQEYKNRYASSSTAFMLHGDSMMELKRFEEAIVDFEKAMELDNAESKLLKYKISRCQKLIKSQATKN